jgi:hypothetical protein
VTNKEEKFRRRAVKAGVRATKRLHHPLSEAELRSLKVQVMPALPRILLGALGVIFGLSAACGWPSDSNGVQGFLGAFGVLSTLFGFFGVRKTIGGIADSIATEGVVELVGGILGSIADAVDL